MSDNKTTLEKCFYCEENNISSLMQKEWVNNTEVYACLSHYNPDLIVHELDGLDAIYIFKYEKSDLYEISEIDLTGIMTKAKLKFIVKCLQKAIDYKPKNDVGGN